PGIDPTGVQDFEGIQYCTELTRLSSYNVKGMSNPKLPEDMSSLTKLTKVGFENNEVDNQFVERLGTIGCQMTQLYLDGNHIYDLSPLNGKFSGTVNFN
ncbi:hypothetical protein, partial [Enterococcus sp. C76]|uniref:hypothetical protein n=1 Tax=Enterococcus sp. C76 TaxID=3231334 RepID=UPI00349FFF44